MAVDQFKLDAWFEYSPARKDQVELYRRIRVEAKNLAQVILDNTPASADQSAAIRHVREAMWSAHAAIGCGGV